MKLARTLALAAAVVTLAIPALASAQGAKPAKAAAQPAADAEDGRSYEYKFGDDDLLGNGIGLDTPILRVGTMAIRSQLIRPRTNFVPELLKSAEGF